MQQGSDKLLEDAVLASLFGFCEYNDVRRRVRCLGHEVAQVA
jgi:hypothetical protein